MITLTLEENLYPLPPVPSVSALFLLFIAWKPLSKYIVWGRFWSTWKPTCPCAEKHNNHSTFQSYWLFSLYQMDDSIIGSGLNRYTCLIDSITRRCHCPMTVLLEFFECVIGILIFKYK